MRIVRYILPPIYNTQKMNEDHKLYGLKPVVTSTPCGKSIGNMWGMLNSVISPIGNLTDNVTNEKKLLPRPVQRNSAPRPSGQQTGKNVLNNTNYLAEYRSSIKHTGTQSQFARLEVIESDDDDEVIPQIAKVIDKNVIGSIKKKKISESHALIHGKGEFKHTIRETTGELASEVVEAENKVIKNENDPVEGKYLRKTEVNVLIPKRIPVKEPNVSKKEGTKIKKLVVSTVRCKPVNKKISLQPTKQTFQKENEPSIEETDASESGQYKLRKHKPELNSLINSDSSISKSSQLIHQKDELSIEVIDAAETEQYRLRKLKLELNSIISNDSSVSKSSQLIHQKDKPSLEIIETQERGQYNLRKRKQLNSSRSIELNVSKSNKLTLQKDISDTGDKEKDVSSVTVNRTCKQKYITQKKTDSSRSKKIPHQEECFSTFEEAVFHKKEGVAMATCVSVTNFTAGYVEIDRQRLFSSKTTNLVFHVLEGEPEVTIDKITKCVKPGTFVYIPPGSCYHIKNSCSERVRLSYTKVVT